MVVEPADQSITITNHMTMPALYHAFLVDPDGTRHDVTGTATFNIDALYGQFYGPTALITGKGAGPTRVSATQDGVTGDTGLTVFVKTQIDDPQAPTEIQQMFDAATEDPTLVPTIVYPSDKILVPPNLGQFDIHWKNNPATDYTPKQADMFEIEMSNQYVDVKLFTSGLHPEEPYSQKYWTVFAPEDWYPVASSRQQLTFTVAGMHLGDPTKKGTAASQHVDVTNEDARGGIYYWTTSSPEGIYRYDVSTPGIAPAPMFADSEEPGGYHNCMGCHSMSRDGSKLALTIDGGGGRGTVIDVATRHVLVPYESPDGGITPVTPLYWNFATFAPDGNKLVTVQNGIMTLRDTNGGAALATIDNGMATVPNGSGTMQVPLFATHPEISPDGTKLVNVEEGTNGYYETDYEPTVGRLVVHSLDLATNTVGPAVVLLDRDTAGDNLSSFYPSFSPDGNWLIMTRNTGYAYNNSASETWVMKADGSAAPIKLDISNDSATNPNLTNSWARWVPFAQTFGPTNEPMFYLTWSSTRPFGNRIPGGGRPQIWMTPFFPDRAAAGMDPSGNAFRVPFQRVDTANHIAQWTQAVVQ